MHKNSAESNPFSAPDALFTAHKPQPQPQSTPFVPPANSAPLSTPVKSDEHDESDTSEQPTNQSPKKKSAASSVFSVIGLCIVATIIALIGLIVYYFYKRKFNNEDTSSDQSEPDDSPNINTILETYRKNDAILKHQLSEYEHRLRAYEHKIDELSKRADPNFMLQQHRIQHNLPTEADYDDAPIKPKENKSEEEKNPKEKRDELVRMMNQPRRTIQDDIDEQNELKEATRQQQEDKTTEILTETTNSDKIFTSNNDVDENDLIAAITNGGMVKD